jgi:hypothetical protein
LYILSKELNLKNLERRIKQHLKKAQQGKEPLKREGFFEKIQTYNGGLKIAVLVSF